MIGKITAFLLCFMLVFSFGVCAENTADTGSQDAQPTIEQQGEMPMRGGNGERMGGGRQGGMGRPPMGEMPQGERMQPPQMPTDENGNAMQPPQMQNETPSGETAQQPIADNAEGAAENEQNQLQLGEFTGGMPRGNDMSGVLNINDTQPAKSSVLEFVKTNSTPIISIILLALAFVFVIFYRRKNY